LTACAHQTLHVTSPLPVDFSRLIQIPDTGVSPINWSVAEVSTAIVCASVPSLRPLALRLFPLSWQSDSLSHPEPTRVHAIDKASESSSSRGPNYGQGIDLDDLESGHSGLDNLSLRSTIPLRA